MSKKSKSIQPLINSSNLNQRDFIIIGIISFLSLVLFGGTLNFEFTNWDDPDYVYNNPIVRGLSLENIKSILTTPVIGMYNPLTFLVYAIEYELFGLNPKMFHFTNLMLHLIALGILYQFIKRLTGRYESATIVTILFAIHPMHVSVVAWVSQTKTSLMFIFYILSIISYLKYLDDGRARKQLYWCFLWYLLSLLSKPDAVTLPLILFLLDYYRNRNWEPKVFLEKAPLLFISLCFGILTLYTHSEAKDVIFEVSKKYSFFHQIMVSNYALVFYINKFFMPLHLTAIYPYPEVSTYLPIKYYLSLPIIPIIIFITYKAGTFRREMIFGLLFFLITIFILVKFIPSGFFRAANRYSYLSYTGLIFIVGQYFVYLLDNRIRVNVLVKRYILLALVGFVVFFSYRVTIRVNTWRNSIALFDDVIKKRPNVSIAFKNRGNAKMKNGDLQGALYDYEEAFKQDTSDLEVVNNIAAVNITLGNTEEAISLLDYVIVRMPDNDAVYFNRALAKYAIKDVIGGLEDMKKAALLGNTYAIENVKINDSDFYRLKLMHATTMR